MEEKVVNISLHPYAKELLFMHFQTVNRIFSDILGLLEVDFIEISLIDPTKELIFISSAPSVEWNLIENGLWKVDEIFSDHFFLQNKLQWWDELYEENTHPMLLHYRKFKSEFKLGLSIPAKYNEYDVIYSFALKTNNPLIKAKLSNNSENSCQWVGFVCKIYLE